MKNTMKKLFLLTLALVMVLGLAGCSGETNAPVNSVSLVDVTTPQGISLKIPADMPLQDNGGYTNVETGETVSFGVAEDGGTPLSSWKEEDVLATYQSKYSDVVVKSFENGKQINGKEALQSMVTMTTPGGNALTITLVIVADGSKNYVVNFGYGSDKTDGALAKNLQACVDSITIK